MACVAKVAMANVSVVSIVGVAEIAMRHPGMVALIRVGEIAVLYVRSIHRGTADADARIVNRAFLR